MSSQGTKSGASSRGIWNTAPEVERIETKVLGRKRAQAGDEKQTLKAARDTLHNDIKRMIRQPVVWQPQQCRIPKIYISDVNFMPQYISEFLLRPGEDQPLCIRDKACVGRTLAIAFRRNGYTLGRFKTPLGRTVAGLCILCLKQALSNQDKDRSFNVSDYVLEENWRLR